MPEKRYLNVWPAQGALETEETPSSILATGDQAYNWRFRVFYTAGQLEGILREERWMTPLCQWQVREACRVAKYSTGDSPSKPVCIVGFPAFFLGYSLQCWRDNWAALLREELPEAIRPTDVGNSETGYPMTPLVYTSESRLHHLGYDPTIKGIGKGFLAAVVSIQQGWNFRFYLAHSRGHLTAITARHSDLSDDDKAKISKAANSLPEKTPDRFTEIVGAAARTLDTVMFWEQKPYPALTWKT